MGVVLVGGRGGKVKKALGGKGVPSGTFSCFLAPPANASGEGGIGRKGGEKLNKKNQRKNAWSGRTGVIHNSQKKSSGGG